MSRPARVASSAPVTVTIPQSTTTAVEPEDDLAPERTLSFWEQVALVPEHLWWDGSDRGKGYRIYCYDEDGPQVYFALLHEPVDQEWVRKNWGGGTYKFNLNDVENKFKASTKIRIEGESKRKKPNGSAQIAPVAAAPDPFQSQVLQIIQDGQRRQEQFLERLFDRERDRGVPATTPAQIDPTAIFRGMVEMFKEMLPRQSAQDPMAMMLQLKQLMGEPRDFWGDLAKMKEAGLIGGNSTGGGTGNLLKEMETIMTVAEKLGFQAGGGKGWAEILIEKGPEIAGQVRAIMGDYKNVEQARAQTADRVLKIQENQKATQAVPGPAANPQNARVAQPPPAVGSVVAAHSQPQPAAQHSLDVEPITEPTAGQVVAEISAAAVDLIKRKIVELVLRGTPGAAIVSWLDVEAPILVGGFEGLTEDQLIQACAFDPILSQCQASPRFRTCVHEIVEALNDVEEEELGPQHGPN